MLVAGGQLLLAAFELASSNATPNVANHVVRIVRSGGSEGTYDVAYTMTPTGLTGASARASGAWL